MSDTVDWNWKLNEVADRLRSSYDDVGRATAARFLAIVYPPDAERAVLREWRALTQSLRPEIIRSFIDVLKVTSGVVQELGADAIVESIREPMPGSHPEGELANLWLTSLTKAVQGAFASADRTGRPVVSLEGLAALYPATGPCALMQALWDRDGESLEGPVALMTQEFCRDPATTYSPGGSKNSCIAETFFEARRQERIVRIAEIFVTKVEDKIDPVVKVGEIKDEAKLASEIGSYVVTPAIEKYVDDFLEHFTDTIRLQTTEIGVWISGYFGSGKSYLAKVLVLLAQNRSLAGQPAAKPFEPRIVASARRDSIVRSLARTGDCACQTLAFNLNTLVDSKKTPLPRLLLSQYYLSKGYRSNFLYARVIEQEVDLRSKLPDLHAAVERRTKKPWPEIQKYLGFYAKHLYAAACDVAPEAFDSPEDVAQALKNAEKGEIYNTQFLVQTMLDDLARREKETDGPCRILLVLDESGQWIEDDSGRLAQLQALVEEAAIKGQGKIWVFVTTHEDMGSVFQNARALEGNMKKIEGRFRFKFSLTTENNRVGP